jgi:type III restriction enzyme
MAEALEGMAEVVHYVKNHGLNFTIPYTFEGKDGHYIPDFIVHYDDGHANGREDLLNLIVEVSGNPDPKKPAKTATARDLWIPAVNNDGRFGRWDFINISDPWDAQNTIRAHLKRGS